MERAFIQANRIAGIEYPLRLAVLVLRLGNADLQAVLAGGQLGVAHVEPGDLAKERDLHQIRGQIVRTDRLPRIVVDAVLKRRSGELEPDPAPDLVIGQPS